MRSAMMELTGLEKVGDRTLMDSTPCSTSPTGTQAETAAPTAP